MTGDNDVAEVCRQLEVSQPTYYIPPATTPTKSVTYAPQFIAQTNHSASDPTGSKNLVGSGSSPLGVIFWLGRATHRELLEDATSLNCYRSKKGFFDEGRSARRKLRRPIR